MTRAITNWGLKDGHAVRLKVHHKADFGYYFDENTGVGSWDVLHVLSGAVGKIVHARTPAIFSPKGKTKYFANVDFEVSPGVVARVRCDHQYLTRRAVGRASC